MIIFSSDTVEETQILASKLAKIFVEREISGCIALNGTLGAGKTAFTKGFASGLGIEDEVVSPSFGILHEYQAKTALLHSDFYRLELEDLPHLGLEEQIECFEGIVIVEWANMFPALLPLEYIELKISVENERRICRAQANEASLLSILDAWYQACKEEN